MKKVLKTVTGIGLWLLVFFALDAVVHAQQPQLPDLIPYRKGDKWGYCDRNKKIVIECKYDDVEPFEGKVAKVYLNGKWGFVDKSGKEVIPPKYDNVLEWRDEMVMVEVNGVYGFVNKNGEEVIKPMFRLANDFNEGLAAVLYDRWKYIDKNGKELSIATYSEVGNFSEGMSAVCSNEKWGFIDRTGKEVVPLKYEKVKGFSEGLVAVCLNGKWGYIDKRGGEIVALKFEDARFFSEGLAGVKLNGKYGFIDRTGNFVVKPEYDDVSDFSGGLAAVRKERFWGYIDKKGKAKTKFEYVMAFPFFKEGFAIVEVASGKDWVSTIIDREGKEIFSNVKEKYEIRGGYSEGLFCVEKDDKIGFVDSKGKVVIPVQYQLADNRYPSFRNGIALVMYRNRKGYIDIYGNQYWDDLRFSYSYEPKKKSVAFGGDERFFNQNSPKFTINASHQSYINSVAFSPDGKVIVSTSADYSVKFWETKTGRLLKTLNFDFEVRDAKFSPNGKYVAICGASPRVFVYDVNSGEIYATLQAKNEKEVNSIFWSNNSQNLFSAGDDKVVKRWNINDGKINQFYVGHLDEITQIAVSDDERFLSSASSDKTVKIWDATSLKLLHTVSIHATSLTFSYDSKYLIVGSWDGTIKILDVSSAKIINVFKDEFAVRSVALNPVSPIVASVSEGSSIRYADIKLWDFVEGSELFTMSAFDVSVKSICFSSDGKYLVWGGDLTGIKVLDIKSKKIITYIDQPFYPISCFSYTQDGKKLALAIGYAIHLWDVEFGTRLATLTGHRAPVLALNFSPDGEVLVSASGSDAGNEDEKDIVFWDMNTFKEIKRWKNIKQYFIKDENNFSSVVFSPDGRLLVLASDGDLLMIRDVRTDEKVFSQKWGLGEKYLTFSPDGKYLAVACGSEVKVLDVGSKNVVFNLTGHTNSINTLAFSPDGKFLASGSGCTAHYFLGKDFLIKIWDMKTGTLVRTLKGHDEYVKALSFSLDGRWLVSGSGFSRGKDAGRPYNSLKIWNVATGNEIWSTVGHEKDIIGVRFHPSKELFVTVSKDGTAKIWNFTKRTLVAVLVNDNRYANKGVIYTPDNFYTGTKESMYLVHNVLNRKAYSFDQFDLQYNRPDIVLERLGLASPEVIQAYRKAYEKRLRKMGFNPANFEKEFRFNAPEVKLKSEDRIFVESSEPNYTLTFTAEDKLFNLERYFVTVNGVPLYGLQGKKFETVGKKAEQTVTIPLSTGTNTVKISVLNQKGVESLAEQIEVTYNPVNPVKPNLYVISIGVSKFKQSEYNLTYADKDAADIVNLFKQQSNKYGEVKTFLLQNQQATVEKILALRSELEKTRPDDQVVMFIATHGLLDNDLDYYLATYDVNFAQPQKRGLRYDKLEALLDGIPARKKLLLIDACHSGEVDKEESQLVAANLSVDGNVKSRGFKAVKKKGTTIGLKTSFELMKELFTDLRRNSGTVVISSAGGAEYAYETQELHNGVFTYSVIEGLQKGRADLNGNKKIYVSELMTYVGNRVKELTGGKQNPTSRAENLESDFVIW